MRIAALVALGATIAWVLVLFIGGIYRLFDDRAGNDSIVGIVLAGVLLLALIGTASRFWRRHPPRNFAKPS